MYNFQHFLQTKDQNYTKIDKFRVFRIFEKYKDYFKTIKIIHIIGTNGKGSTGRFLAQLLRILDYKVGHYISPHIFTFNERFWLDGKIINDNTLNLAHDELLFLLKNDIYELSYFEYATFLAAVLFRKCDFIIFEAGLGGEYDATSIFEKRLSIFTPIGFDHMHILGDTIEQIAKTKLKVMSKLALISHDQDQKVLNIAFKIAKLKNTNLLLLNKDIHKDYKALFMDYVYKYNLPDFLQHNLHMALYALFLLLKSKSKMLDALKNLDKLSLRARCEKINENLYIDVGHNEMAAKAILQKFKNTKIILIYNSFIDKDCFKILSILKPIIIKIKLYKYESKDRVLANNQILSIAKKLNIVINDFDGLDKNNINLVFGSFVLVENFLRDFSVKR